MSCNYVPNPYVSFSNVLRASPPGNLSISGWVGEGMWCVDERLSGRNGFLNEDCVVFFCFPRVDDFMLHSHPLLP